MKLQLLTVLLFALYDLTTCHYNPEDSLIRLKGFPFTPGRSPINIDHSSAVFKSIPPALRLRFRNHNRRISYKVHNDGYSVEVDPQSDVKDRPTVIGGPLLSPYYFLNIHFHWGWDNNNGSEHAINGVRYPAEMHVVYGNAKYTFEEFRQHNDSIFQISFLLKICERPTNPDLEKLIRLAEQVKEPNAEIRLTDVNFPLTWVQEFQREAYYFYDGTITALRLNPPYDENVVWVVSTSRLCITQQAINALRGIKEEGGRPKRPNNNGLQPIGDRVVYKTH